MSDQSRVKILGSWRRSTRLKGKTLTCEKLAQERLTRIEDPSPAEEEYVHMPKSHMIKKADLTKAGGRQDAGSARP